MGDRDRKDMVGVGHERSGSKRCCYTEDTLSTKGWPMWSLTTGGAHEETQRPLEKTRLDRRSDQTIERLRRIKVRLGRDKIPCIA